MFNMHLIINTHWDREYRWSFSETQVRLAEAVDDLIDIMQKDSDFTYFHTDSQVSMLDDYLALRPERAEELKELVKAGRILTGPWYTLPAEFLVSGESLVRNLLLGYKLSNELGKVMKAAYNIFSWGQVSQLPQIYKQFGMHTIVFYRGLDQAKLDNLEFKWISPDGSEALGITFGAYHRLNFWRYVYIPYILGSNSVSGSNYSISRDSLGDGYLFQMCSDSIDEVNHSVINQSCARDIDGALEGMKELVSSVDTKSSTDNLLFLQGFDQENPDPIVSELLAEINKRIDYGTIKVSSLEDYIDIINKELKQKGIYDTLPVRKGEMLEIEKNHDAFGPLYNGVFSARMPIKLKNVECQYLLEGWAEPAAILSMIAGGAYPVVAIQNAWKEILKNQQHDGIGGCHVDRVTKTMDERYENAKDIAETVIKTSLRNLTCQIDFSKLGQKEIGLVVFNSTAFVRSDIILVTMDIPFEWGFRGRMDYKRDFMLEITDENGSLMESQILVIDDDTVYGYLKFGNVIGYDCSRCTIALRVDAVPSIGYRTYTVKPVKAKHRPVEMLSSEPNILENSMIKATIHGNGAITLYDKSTKKTMENLHYFEDTSEKGGPLIFDMTYEKGLMTTLGEKPEISLVYNGPLYTKYRIAHTWMLPEGLEDEMKIHVPHGSEWISHGKTTRSTRKVPVEIVTEVVLKKDSSQLEFVTVVDNKACNHRLRVMFPTNYKDASSCLADSPFDVVERSIAVEDSTGWYEEAARTWPSQSFVSVGDQTSRLLVSHKGIPEYEVTDSASRTVGLTLIRAFGTAGNPTETYRYQELAQCLGKNTFKYSIGIHPAQQSQAKLQKQSLLFNIPLQAAQTTKHTGVLAPVKSFITVSDERFIVTAVKKAEREDGIVIRGYNLSDVDIKLSIQCDFALASSRKINLEELDIEKLQTTGNEIQEISVGKREIASILIKIK